MSSAPSVVETRAAWNTLIGQINSLAASCTGVSPLPTVGPSHIWTVADIQAARNKLTQVCSTTTFSPTALTLWKQSIITELQNAIANNCGDCGGGAPGPIIPPGTTFVVLVVCDGYGPEVDWNGSNGYCEHFEGVWGYQPTARGSWPIAQISDAYAERTAMINGEIAAGSPCPYMYTVMAGQVFSALRPTPDGGGLVGSCTCNCVR